MKYIIDTEVANKLDLELPDLFALLLVKTGVDIPKVFDTLEQKKCIISITKPNGYKFYTITQHWDDVVSDVLLTSEKTIPTDDELIPLAEKLMAIFPQGKKPDTPYYWKCNKREVVLKLKSFYKLYGTKYTEQEILDAAYNYVASFHGDYRFMRLLKYFIWKKDDGVEISELATFIENKDSENINDNWVNELK